MPAKTGFSINHPMSILGLYYTEKFVVATTFAGPTTVLDVQGCGEDFESSQPTRTFELGRAWCHTVYGNTIVAGNEDGVVRVWDLITGVQTRSFVGLVDSVKAVSTLGDTRIVAGALDGKIIVWDTLSGDRQQTLIGHTSSIQCLQAHRNMLISSDLDGLVKLWNMDDWTCSFTLEGHDSFVINFGISDDGEMLATAQSRGLFKIWTISDGQHVATCTGHAKVVTQFHNLSNDVLMTSGADGTFRTWRWTTGELIRATTMHDNAVRGFIVDGVKIISAGMDGKLRLWDYQTSELLGDLKPSDGCIWHLVGRGRMFAVAFKIVQGSHRVEVWDSQYLVKFGKHIQKRQLDLPEYAASFVDYKALKKLIKKLSATPIISASDGAPNAETLDPQASLQANKATFFFRLERELEKVNIFYLQKEAELQLRLKTLMDKKSAMQSHPISASKLSAKYIALEEGFRQFSSDLNKLQQFVEINATAFSKILKKWDKTSKSRTKELYLSRAVEVQPCFNRDVISDLSDKATTSLLDFSAWAEGEKMQYTTTNGDHPTTSSADTSEQGDVDLDPQIVQAIAAGNISIVQEWASRTKGLPDAKERITRALLTTVDDAPDECLKLLLDTGLVDYDEEDEINERTCLHKAAICGRNIVINYALIRQADLRAMDVYSRIPLHYACMHGRYNMIRDMLTASPDIIDIKDQDNFTPLIHAIVHSQLECVQFLLQFGARIDPQGENDHIPLNMACQYASQSIVELLLQKQPQILPDAEGLYPQHLVARSGLEPQLLVTLKDHNVNLDQPDKLYQWTPLFHAASEGHVRCLQILLQCGVNPDIMDEKGLSAMYYATWEGHLECMKLLASVTRSAGTSGVGIAQSLSSSVSTMPPPESHPSSTITPTPMSMEGSEGIPDLSLPPPIIPLRRYGHNFLDNKTFVVLSFEDAEAIQFYDDNKYPAARLTISSKSSDLIPRNIMLPIQDEFKVISFQIDNLDSFAIDFDIYPTFGAKVIARTVVSSRVFTGKVSSSGYWHSELFDSRLRAIGRVAFEFHVVKPFPGIPLEISHFATYWKATSQFNSQPNALITGSSLSGEYVRLFVQLTSDGVPVLYPRWRIRDNLIDIPVSNLTYDQFVRLGAGQGGGDAALAELSRVPTTDIATIHHILAGSFATLREALALLPAHVHLELHALYPTRAEEQQLRLGPTANINDYTDAVLTVVFEHARHLRGQQEGFVRSMVFSSFNQDICTALNWKQPNYPVLLCNELGASAVIPSDSHRVQSSGRTTISVKEAVNIATNNNFMGLICSSRLLDLAPALIGSIKTAGLVLITDISEAESTNGDRGPLAMAAPVSHSVPAGVDGSLKANGVLRFNETIDM